MRHPFDVYVGDRIRQVRSRAGLSQQEFGEMLKISEIKLQAVEKGKVRVDPELIRDVVGLLDVPPSFLFKGLANALRQAA